MRQSDEIEAVKLGFNFIVLLLVLQVLWVSDSSPEPWWSIHNNWAAIALATKDSVLRVYENEIRTVHILLPQISGSLTCLSGISCSSIPLDHRSTGTATKSATISPSLAILATVSFNRLDDSPLTSPLPAIPTITLFGPRFSQDTVGVWIIGLKNPFR